MMATGTEKKNCPHSEWYHGHCAEMSCSNYVNKCPFHGIVQSPGDCPLSGAAVGVASLNIVD